MYEPGGPFVEELHILRRKNRQLEGQLRKAHAELRRVMELGQQQQQQVDSYLSRRTAEADSEVVRVRSECEAIVEEARAKHAASVDAAVRSALDRQLIELTGSAEERAALKEEQQKEERIEMLRRQMVRRTMHRELYGGWQAWVELWEARAYAHGRLREVCARFKSPKLSFAFFFWARETEAERVRQRVERGGQEEQQMLRIEIANLTRELEHARSDAERRLKLAEHQKELALEKQRVMLTGSAEEQEAERRREEREGRIEMMRRQVARRMLYADLAHGWSAWLELWRSRTYALDKLRECGNRLRKPELAQAFRAWVRLQSLTARAEERTKWGGLSAEKRALELRLEQMQAEASRRALEMEEEKQQALESLRIELAGTLAEQAAHRAEVEKEARVSHLEQQLARRMLRSDVRRGWMAWHAHWRRYARLRTTDASEETLQRVRALEAERGALAAEVTVLKADLSHAAAKAEHEKRVALERQLRELTGDAEEQQRAIETKEKEARVELLRRQMARRWMSKDLSRGWQAWVDLWSAKRLALMTLRHAANLLRSPEVSISFRAWAETARRGREAQQRAQHESGLAALRAERDGFEAALQAVRADCDAKLAQATADRLQLLEQVARLSGGQSEREALLEAQASAAREERVEMLRRQIGRRMLHRDLAAAWTAWAEQWEGGAIAKRRLQKAANRLRSPHVEASFRFWRRDWQRAQKELADEAFESRESQLLEELEAVKAECERRVKELELEQQRQYDRLVVELTGSATERAAMEEEKAKEERVELLTRQMGRRAMYREVYNGWSAWIELWESRTYALDKLRDVANRLQKPELAYAFHEWVEGNREEKRAAELEALQLEGRSLEAQLRAAKFEAGQMRMHKAKLDDELSDLKRRLDERQARLDSQVHHLEAASQLPAEIDSLRARCASLEEATATAGRKLEEAEEDAARQRDANHELLEKLLAQQRGSFEEELAALKRTIASLEARPPVAAAPPPLPTAVAVPPADSFTDRSDSVRNGKPGKKPSPAERKEGGRTKKSILGNIDLDEGPDAPPVKDQIAGHISKNSMRVMDLFREWDTDGDGEISRPEFHDAMKRLGLEVPKEEVDALFDEWDRDGGGTIDFRELQKILNSHNSAAAAPKKGKAALKAAGSKLLAAAAIAK